MTPEEETTLEETAPDTVKMEGQEEDDSITLKKGRYILLSGDSLLPSINNPVGIIQFEFLSVLRFAHQLYKVRRPQEPQVRDREVPQHHSHLLKEEEGLQVKIRMTIL